MKKITLLFTILFGFNQLMIAQDNFWGTVSNWFKPAVALFSFSTFIYMFCDHIAYTKQVERFAKNKAEQNKLLKEKLRRTRKNHLQREELLYETITEAHEANLKIEKLQKDFRDSQYNLFDTKKIVRELITKNKGLQQQINTFEKEKNDSLRQKINAAREYTNHIREKHGLN